MGVVVSMLELARAEMSMDVAVLGEIHDGRVVRLAAGEAEPFGLAVGASLPVEETFLPASAGGRLGWSETRSALDARLCILCCLAHEQRPALRERDVLVLRGLGETIIREPDSVPRG